MGDLPVVIKNTDMPEKLQEEVVQTIAEAVEQGIGPKEIAAFMKKAFDEKMCPTWHCVVGKEFACYVTNEKGYYVYLTFGETALCLFKFG